MQVLRAAREDEPLRTERRRRHGGEAREPYANSLGGEVLVRDVAVARGPPAADLVHRRQRHVADGDLDAERLRRPVERAAQPGHRAASPRTGSRRCTDPRHASGCAAGQHHLDRLSRRMAAGDLVSQLAKEVDLVHRIPAVFAARAHRRGEAVPTLPRPHRGDRDAQSRGDDRDRQPLVGDRAYHDQIHADSPFRPCILHSFNREPDDSLSAGGADVRLALSRCGGRSCASVC